MASTIANPEIGIRAAVDQKGRAPAYAAGSKEAEAASTIAKGIESRTPASKIIESLAIPMDKGKVSRTVGENIGWERNADGSRKLSVAEQARVREVKKYQDNIRDLREKGYDALTTAQKDSLVKQTDQVLSEVPQIKDWLSTISPTVRKQICEDLIKSPGFIAKLEAKNSEVLSKVVEGSVRDRKALFDEKKEGEDILRKKINGINTEWNDVQSALDEYKTGGLKQIELQALIARMPTLTKDFQRQRTAVEDLTDEIRTLKSTRIKLLAAGRETKDIDSELGIKTTELKDARNEEQKTEDAITRKAELEQEQKALGEKQKTLEEQKTTTEESMRTAKRERLAAQTELSLARIEKTEAEDEYVADHRNCFKDAMRDLVQDRMDQMEESRIAALETEKANAVDPAEKFLIDNLQKRWYEMATKGIFKSKDVKVLNKDQINADWDTLMRQGPEKLMETMLFSATSPLTHAEVMVKIKDPQFMEKNMPRAIEGIISKRIQIGKLTEGEVRTIIDSPWGAGMIDKAIVNKNELNEVMKKLSDEKVYEGSFGEWMKKKSNGSVLKMFLLLFGTAFLGAVPLYKATKDSIS